MIRNDLNKNMAHLIFHSATPATSGVLQVGSVFADTMGHGGGAEEGEPIWGMGQAWEWCAQARTVAAFDPALAKQIQSNTTKTQLKTHKAWLKISNGYVKVDQNR